MTESQQDKHAIPEPIATLEGWSWEQLPLGTLARSSRDGKVYRKENGSEGREVWWDEEKQVWHEGMLNTANLIDGQGFDVLELPSEQEVRGRLLRDIEWAANASTNEAVAENLDAVIGIAHQQQSKVADILGHAPHAEPTETGRNFLRRMPFSEVPNFGKILVAGRRGVWRKEGDRLTADLSQGAKLISPWYETTIAPDTIVTYIAV